MTYRCGIIGTGVIAGAHAQAINASTIAELAAASDIDQARAQAFTKQWGGTACADLSALLAEKCDILIVCTPDETHAKILETIVTDANAPKILIMEKPLCVAPWELKHLDSIVKGAKTHVIIEHTRRFNAAFMDLKKLIDSGELGNLRSGHWRYYAGWLHIGVHAVDTQRMLIGECQCMNAVADGTDRYLDDPMLHVTLESKRYPDAPIKLEAVPEHPYALFDAEMLFEKGRIALSFDDIFISRVSKTPSGRPYLPLDRHVHADSTITSLGRLLEQCAALLERNDRTVLDAAGYDAARGTMEVLFDAMDKAA